MIRYSVAVGGHPPCGNNSNGQLCALPMLHDGQHAQADLSRIFQRTNAR